MKTWTCDLGHKHGFARGNSKARDGDPCRMRKVNTDAVKMGELMSKGGLREPPKRIERIVSGGLPGTGKKRGKR